MKTKNLELMSMEELSRIAQNEGEDNALRELAQNKLERRESAFNATSYPNRHQFRCVADYTHL